MTVPAKVFKRLLLSKSKYIWLLLLFQLLAIAILLICLNFQSADAQSNTLYLMLTAHSSKFWEQLANLFITSTILTDLVFAGLIINRSEKINLSQTWHLLAVKDTTFWLLNLLSSMLVCAGIFIVQLLLEITSDAFAGEDLSQFVGVNFFETILFITLIALFVFIYSSFINFSSKTLADFFTGKNAILLRIVIIFLLIFFGIYFGFNITDHLMDFLTQRNMFNSDPIALLNWELLIASACFGGLNLWLGKKYFEPKVNNK